MSCRAVPGRTIQPNDLLEDCTGDLGSVGCLLQHYFDYCSGSDGLRLGSPDQDSSVHFMSSSSVQCAAAWSHDAAEWPVGHVSVHNSSNCPPIAGGDYLSQLTAASLALMFDGCHGSPHRLLRPARCALQASTCNLPRQTQLQDLSFARLWDADPVIVCEGYTVGCVVAAANMLFAGASVPEDTFLLDDLHQCLKIFNNNFEYWFHTDGRQLCQMGIGDPIGVNLCSAGGKICPV